jgi:hypothetical protein
VYDKVNTWFPPGVAMGNACFTEMVDYFDALPMRGMGSKAETLKASCLFYSIEDVLGWIDRQSIYKDFIVEVGSGGPSGCSHMRNNISPFYFRTICF